MIKGKLINLRLVEEGDLDILHNLQSDVRESGPFSSLTLRSIVHLKKKFQENGLTTHDNSMLLITDKNNDIIGMIQHFSGAKYSTGYELGSVIYKKENRAKGCVTEALKLYTAYMFESHRIQRLEIVTSTQNIGAQHVALKCGYTFEGINRKACYIKGVATDLHRYSILRN